MLNDIWYSRLKWGVAIVLPALSSLYFGLANIYGWSNAEQVVGTLALLTTFLGTLLGVSTRNYNKTSVADGQIQVNTAEDGTPSLALQLEKTPEELAALRKVRFDVVKNA